MKIIILLCIIFLQVMCAPEQDLVNISQISQVPQNYEHKWYSGYLQASVPGNSIYYMFFESQNNPATDPVVLWLQGGPGCSGLFGAFIENGPIKFHASSTESYLNEFAFNMNASVIYVESPAGVGFSYSQTNTSNDNEATADNIAALHDFFSKYPEYSQNEFYIAGESYGGIYIPYLATFIQESNINNSVNTTINLKGFILGNGCTLGAECTNPDDSPIGFSVYEFQQFNDHGYFSPSDWQEFLKTCTSLSLFNSSQCINVQIKLTSKINFNYLDIDSLNGICYHVPPAFTYSDPPNVYQFQNKYKSRNKRHNQKHHQKHNSKRHLKNNKNKRHIVPELPCDYEVGDYYILNNDTVRAALHINVTVQEQLWESCINDEIYEYTETPQGSFYLYPNLLKSGLKIWIYSGDVDANVPITGTLAWISQLKEQLGLNEIESWRPWYLLHEEGKQLTEVEANSLQVGGMFWDLDLIQFISVRGAGHEVPFWKPKSAYQMFQNYLAGTQLPSRMDIQLNSTNSSAESVMKHYLKKHEN